MSELIPSKSMCCHVKQQLKSLFSKQHESEELLEHDSWEMEETKAPRLPFWRVAATTWQATLVVPAFPRQQTPRRLPLGAFVSSHRNWFFDWNRWILKGCYPRLDLLIRGCRNRTSRLASTLDPHNRWERGGKQEVVDFCFYWYFWKFQKCLKYKRAFFLNLSITGASHSALML